MRGGKLDRTIIIQRRTLSYANDGEPIEAWTTISTRPASISPLQGDERFTGEQLVAKDQVEFITRWAQLISDLSPLDRVVYPSSDSPAERQIYDVIQVSEIGRREGLRIAAFRNPDAGS